MVSVGTLAARGAKLIQPCCTQPFRLNEDRETRMHRDSSTNAATVIARTSLAGGVVALYAWEMGSDGDAGCKALAAWSR
jgi:hypothetical protein